ncbi:transcription factor Fst12 [Purpureocillium lavendulum]|uniref:Transcription factor Fst12 n=1 Tax=Purpureocillium lavendulum TaxID=1247861 RepID=A0AB34G5V9_9HYPO|nr:transcription factor Fst12 [Purpureocillium lavendulum]
MADPTEESLTRITVTPQWQPVGRVIKPYVIATCAVSDAEVATPHLYQARILVDEVDGEKDDGSRPSRAEDFLGGDCTVPLTAALGGKLWFVFENLKFLPAARHHDIRFIIQIWQGEYSASENVWKQPKVLTRTLTRMFFVTQERSRIERNISPEEHQWDMEVVENVVKIRRIEPPLLASSSCFDMWREPRPVMHPLLNVGPWAATSHSKISIPFDC